MLRNAIAAAVAVGGSDLIGHRSPGGYSYSRPKTHIRKDDLAHMESAQRERDRKAHTRYNNHVAGLNGYHPIARAAAAARAASTETIVKPKRVRKPAATKAA